MEREMKKLKTSNDIGFNVEELLGKLVTLQDEYIKMLGKELNETVIIALLHGWKSSQVEYGQDLRRRMAEVKENLA